MKRSKQSLLHRELLGAAWNVKICVLHALGAKTPSAQRGLVQSNHRAAEWFIYIHGTEVGRPAWKQWIDKQLPRDKYQFTDELVLTEGRQ